MLSRGLGRRRDALAEHAELGGVDDARPRGPEEALEVRGDGRRARPQDLSRKRFQIAAR